MSESYPTLTLIQYKNFIKKLGYKQCKKRGKGSHTIWEHKKYLLLTLPNRKNINHYYWNQLKKAIYKDKDWILRKLKEFKFM